MSITRPSTSSGTGTLLNSHIPESSFDKCAPEFNKQRAAHNEHLRKMAEQNRQYPLKGQSSGGSRYHPGEQDSLDVPSPTNPFGSGPSGLPQRSSTYFDNTISNDPPRIFPVDTDPNTSEVGASLEYPLPTTKKTVCFNNTATEIPPTKKPSDESASSGESFVSADENKTWSTQVDDPTSQDTRTSRIDDIKSMFYRWGQSIRSVGSAISTYASEHPLTRTFIATGTAVFSRFMSLRSRILPSVSEAMLSYYHQMVDTNDTFYDSVSQQTEGPSSVVTSIGGSRKK